jgi:hypothetical protein
MAETTRRTVGLNLRTETEGETDAFADAAEQVGELQEAAQAAAPALDDAAESLNAFGDAATSAGEVLPDISESLRDVGAAAQDAGKGAEGAVPHIGGLDDLFKKGAGSAGVFIAKLFLVKEVFELGYKAGEQIRETVDGLFGEGTTDRLVRASRELEVLGNTFDLLSGNVFTSREEAEKLTNGLNILRNAGIDPTGMSAEQVAAKVEELGRTMQATSIAAANAAGGFSKAGMEAANMADRVSEASDKGQKAVADFAKGVGDLNMAFADVDFSTIDDVIAKLREANEEAARLGGAMQKVWDPLGTGGAQLGIPGGLIEEGFAASGRGTGGLL